MTLDFFKIENTKDPQKGLVLISEPLSDDDYFSRSVVLLTEHTSEGSIGFVLNKTTDYVLSDLIPELDSNLKVFKGGPVEPNSLHYIHSIQTIHNAVEINQDLYWGGDFEQIKELLKLSLIKDTQIQFFLGYSGWAPNQLDHELKNNYWIISDIDKEEIFLSRAETFWKEKIKRLGEAYKVWLNVPKNPSLN